jgi:DNA-binding MarR family transcriptional regulator
LTNAPSHIIVFNIILIIKAGCTIDRPKLIYEIIKLDRRIHRIIRRHSADAWMDLNLTAPQVKALFFISNEGDTHPSRLAAAMGVTPPNVTGIVDRLVEQGLLIRQDSPDDRRALVLRVTDRGEAIISGLRGRRTDVLRGIFGRLEADDLAQLAAIYARLAAAACAYEEKDARKDD